eukprot:TRINITY_DN4426_c0_g1_i1.p1 TRINITY_DN4426_c0_g1~~TRINITY_DN4426_c0_g1_i1.p1  ORF type:complete len:1947 (+),score=410.25 TRINITY_DN4426_c0_g1_i1:307-6147(+)
MQVQSPQQHPSPSQQQHYKIKTCPVARVTRNPLRDVEAIKRDWLYPPQWPFTCYGTERSGDNHIVGDISPEELRFCAYQSFKARGWDEQLHREHVMHEQVLKVQEELLSQIGLTAEDIEAEWIKQGQPPLKLIAQASGSASDQSDSENEDSDDDGIELADVRLEALLEELSPVDTDCSLDEEIRSSLSGLPPTRNLTALFGDAEHRKRYIMHRWRLTQRLQRFQLVEKDLEGRAEAWSGPQPGSALPWSDSLFAAIADQLYRKPDDSGTLRTLAAKTIAENPNEYLELFIKLKLPPSTTMNLSVAEMKKHNDTILSYLTKVGEDAGEEKLHAKIEKSIAAQNNKNKNNGSHESNKEDFEEKDKDKDDIPATNESLESSFEKMREKLASISSGVSPAISPISSPMKSKAQFQQTNAQGEPLKTRSEKQAQIRKPSVPLDTSFSEYCEALQRNHKEFGDWLILLALSNQLGVIINVISSTTISNYIQVVPKNVTTPRELWLSHWSNGFFGSLYPKRVALASRTPNEYDLFGNFHQDHMRPQPLTPDAVVSKMKSAVGHLRDLTRPMLPFSKEDETGVPSAPSQTDPYLIDNEVYPSKGVSDWLEEIQESLLHLMLTIGFEYQGLFVAISRMLDVVQRPFPRNADGDYFKLSVDIAGELLETLIEKIEVGFANTALTEQVKKLTAGQDEAKSSRKHMSNIRGQPQFTDYKIVLQSGEEFKVHKAFLAEFLPRFSSEIYQNMKERDLLRIAAEYEGQPIDRYTMDLFLEFIYTGRTEEHPGSQLPSLLALAEYFEVDPLVDHCCKLMADIIDTDNCLEIWDWANRHTQQDSFTGSQPRRGKSWQGLKEVCANVLKKVEYSFSNPSSSEEYGRRPSINDSVGASARRGSRQHRKKSIGMAAIGRHSSESLVPNVPQWVLEKRRDTSNMDSSELPSPHLLGKRQSSIPIEVLVHDQSLQDDTDDDDSGPSTGQSASSQLRPRALVRPRSRRGSVEPSIAAAVAASGFGFSSPSATGDGGRGGLSAPPPGFAFGMQSPQKPLSNSSASNSGNLDQGGAESSWPVPPTPSPQFQMATSKHPIPLPILAQPGDIFVHHMKKTLSANLNPFTTADAPTSTAAAKNNEGADSSVFDEAVTSIDKLFDAVRAADISEVKLLLDSPENNLDVNIGTEYGYGLLHCCCHAAPKGSGQRAERYLELVLMLLDKGAKFDGTALRYSRDPLYYACERGCIPLVKELLLRVQPLIYMTRHSHIHAAATPEVKHILSTHLASLEQNREEWVAGNDPSAASKTDSASGGLLRSSDGSSKNTLGENSGAGFNKDEDVEPTEASEEDFSDGDEEDDEEDQRGAASVPDTSSRQKLPAVPKKPITMVKGKPVKPSKRRDMPEGSPPPMLRRGSINPVMKTARVAQMLESFPQLDAIPYDRNGRIDRLNDFFGKAAEPMSPNTMYRNQLRRFSMPAYALQAEMARQTAEAASAAAAAEAAQKQQQQELLLQQQQQQKQKQEQPPVEAPSEKSKSKQPAVPKDAMPTEDPMQNSDKSESEDFSDNSDEEPTASPKSASPEFMPPRMERRGSINPVMKIPTVASKLQEFPRIAAIPEYRPRGIPGTPGARNDRLSHFFGRKDDEQNQMIEAAKMRANSFRRFSLPPFMLARRDLPALVEPDLRNRRPSLSPSPHNSPAVVLGGGGAGARDYPSDREELEAMLSSADESSGEDEDDNEDFDSKAVEAPKKSKRRHVRIQAPNDDLTDDDFGDSPSASPANASPQPPPQQLHSDSDSDSNSDNDGEAATDSTATSSSAKAARQPPPSLGEIRKDNPLFGSQKLDKLLSRRPKKKELKERGILVNKEKSQKAKAQAKGNLTVFLEQKQQSAGSNNSKDNNQQADTESGGAKKSRADDDDDDVFGDKDKGDDWAGGGAASGSALSLSDDEDEPQSAKAENEAEAPHTSSASPTSAT